MFSSRSTPFSRAYKRETTFAGSALEVSRVFSPRSSQSSHPCDCVANRGGFAPTPQEKRGLARVVASVRGRVNPCLRRIRVGYVILAVSCLQAFFLYLEFRGGLDGYGYEACSGAAGQCRQRIPKIVHQTYKTESVPPNWASTPPAWKTVHPGWQYEFWTDARNRQLIADYYPEFLEMYDSYPYGIQRSDAARYFILHKYGGVYADLDIQPRRPVGEILGDAELVLPQTPNFGLTNAFMASVPGSPFFRHVIDQLPSHANKWYQVTRHWKIMTSTGPTFIWSLYDAWTGDKSRVNIVPASHWGKCSICKRRCRDIDTSPLHHLTGNSWFAIDSFIMNYVIMCNTVPVAICALFLVDLYRLYGVPGVYKSSKSTRAFAMQWLAYFAIAYALFELKRMP